MNTQYALQQAFQLLNGGNLPMAGQLFEGILQQEPQNFAALNGRGFIALQQNRLVQSAADFQKSLAINPKQPFALKMLGIVQGAMGQFEASMDSFSAALALDAKDPEVYFNRANFRFQAGQAQEALADLDAAIKLRGSYLEARSNRASLLIQLSDFARAEKDLDYLVTQVTNNPDIWVALGLAKHKVGKQREAMQCNEWALKLVPDHPDALLNSSSATYEQSEYPAALAWAEKAVAATPARAEAHYAKAQALIAMSCFDEALAAYSKAIDLNPNYAEAWMGRGLTKARLRDLDGAFVDYHQSLTLNPEYDEAFNNLGIAYATRGDFQSSINCFQNALRVRSDNWDSRLNLANVLEALDRYEEAIKALEEGGDISVARSSIRVALYALRMKVCDWREYDQQVVDIQLMIKNDEKVGAPFWGLMFPLTPLEQQSLAKHYISNNFAKNGVESEDFSPAFGEKIKIAYISSDFWNHPVTHLLAGLFEQHDRARFEVIALSLESRDDEWCNRVINGVDQFVDVQNKTDSEIAHLARSMGVNIAIDLNGHTKNARTGVFALRAAPVQISYIGYLGTMGAPYYDYLIADKALVPERSKEFYTEKIIYLPCYQCNDSKFKLTDQVLTRSAFGLPESDFVFCSFNNNYKITPVVFECWMRILKAVPGSILWIYASNHTAKKNIQLAANELGIDSARLIFADQLPLAEHISRQALADLFLDTFPYNAGATASNALRVGLPLITLVGESFQSRYGASLLSAMGVSELMVDTIASYEALAIDLAKKPEKLTTIRQKLMNNRSTTALFDTPRFTKV